MAYFMVNLNCPNCTRDEHFAVTEIKELFIKSDSLASIDESRAVVSTPSVKVTERFPDTLVDGWGTASCPKCFQPVLIIFKAPYLLVSKSRELKDNTQLKVLLQKHVEIIDWFPKLDIFSHPAIPEKVRNLFRDVQRAEKQKFNPPLVVVGCRSVLEEAVKTLGGQGDTLYDKIEDLYKQGVITRVLKDWATIIRKYGNKAAHEIETTQEEATEMVEFTKIFLEYTFVLPWQVEQKRLQ